MNLIPIPTKEAVMATGVSLFFLAIGAIFNAS